MSGSDERIPVPGVAPIAGTKGNAASGQELKPEEGTLVIDKIRASTGTMTTAMVKVVAGTGYHVSTKFPTTLTLVAPGGVRLEKTAFAAGNERKGDADAFSEQALSFAIKAVADKPGAYEITGTFSFGVCTDENCHPKKQPITIAMAVE